MQKINSHYEKIINSIKNNVIDISERTILLKSGIITIFYIKQLTNRPALSEQVLKPLIQNRNARNIDAKIITNQIVIADECKLDSDENKIETYILEGMTVVLLSSDTEYAVINLKKVETRSISEPETMYTLRGPKDAFIENLDANLSLIKYRLKDKELKIDMLEVGKRTKTPVAVLYFGDIANNTSVNEIKKRINNINIDGIVSSGELQSFLLNNKWNIFPQMGITERPDMASGALLEGKVLVIMESSPWALITPKVFSEYLWASDDYYLNKFFGTFLRILRVIALNLSFIVSSLYAAFTMFHQDTLPTSYIIAIAKARARVPFSALVEVLLIEIIAELIREALIRVPTKIGTAIGIVGAIIIGQAAVSAGVFSPLLLIVISLSLISSFIPADYSIMDPFRVLKFFLILVSGTFGFYGFTAMIVLLVGQLVSINTFGVPYFAPFGPFNFRDFIKSFFYSRPAAPERPEFLRTKDKTRGM